MPLLALVDANHQPWALLAAGVLLLAILLYLDPVQQLSFIPPSNSSAPADADVASPWPYLGAPAPNDTAPAPGPTGQGGPCACADARLAMSSGECGAGGRKEASFVWPMIAGSSLAGGVDVMTFRSRWDCIMTNHGAWVLNETPRLLSGKDKVFENSSEVCSRLYGTNISEINELVRQGKVTPETWDVDKSVKYEWRIWPERACGPIPSAPLIPGNSIVRGRLRRFDGQSLCQALGYLEEKTGKPVEVFVVGDSLAAQFMGSLESQMELYLGSKGSVQLPPMGRCVPFIRSVPNMTEPWAKKAFQYYEKNKYFWYGSHCGTIKVCDGVPIQRRAGGGTRPSNASLVHFGRSLHLSWITASPEAKELFTSQPIEHIPYAWADDLVERGAKVAFLNTGHHIQPHDVFLRRLKFTLELLRKKVPDLIIIFRSTASGVMNCSEYRVPLSIPMSNCGSRHWERFEIQNTLARRLVEDVGGVWMDVFTMTQLRPDWHRHPGDCLHFCMPGPVDTWVQFFTNMLLELA